MAKITDIFGAGVTAGQTGGLTGSTGPTGLGGLSGSTGATGSTGPGYSLLQHLPPKTIGQLLGASTDLATRVQKFEEEIFALNQRVNQQAAAIREGKMAADEREKHVAALQEELGKLQKATKLGFLLEGVSAKAQEVLLRDDEQSEQLRAEFDKPQKLFAVSIDIRRSTELMLKARDPSRFANFITNLCAQLIATIKSNNGVVDKFTGDGILAFFPEFFSGPDAGFYALRAADECHAIFKKHYFASRSSFNSVLTDVGLGIGIDYGEAALVQVTAALTIVGVPVVYACRMGGAPPGETLLNQPAYEVISKRYGAHCLIKETNIEIKHEGQLLAYSVARNGTPFTPGVPPWTQLHEAAIVE